MEARGNEGAGDFEPREIKQVPDTPDAPCSV